MNKALDEVRADETRRMKREGRDPVLKKSRWLLLKRSENLGDDQHFRLRDLLRHNLKTVRAYLLKEAFQQLWDYNSPAWAGKGTHRIIDSAHFPSSSRPLWRVLGRVARPSVSALPPVTLSSREPCARSRHVLRCLLAALAAVCLAHAPEIFEHFWRHAAVTPGHQIRPLSVFWQQ